MTLPKGIQQLYLASGQVCARATPDMVARGLALAVGRAEVPFTPLPEAEMERLPFHQGFPLDETAPIAAEAGLAEMGEAAINQLPDWALENGVTLQVRLFHRDRPAKLPLAGALVLPPSRRPRQFRAALAAHRAEAELQVTIATPAEGKARTETVRIDPNRHGGKFRAGYQEVTIELPPIRHETELSLTLVYKAFRPGDEDNAPYLFLADPEVTDRGRQARPVTGIRLDGSVGKKTNTAWYQARLPAPVAVGAPIEMLAGNTRIAVFSPQSAEIALVEDYGHTLMLTATEPGRYAFYFDGEPAFAAHIGREPTAVRLPAEHLTGETHHISVRDAAGMQVFLETFALAPRILTPEDVLLRESAAPFPSTLSPREHHRYRLMKAALADPGTAAEQRQSAYALEVLEGGYENVKLKPLKFPKVAKPDVSVIIPAHNKIEVTYYGLCALLLAKNAASFEVIVVDDASTDETAELEKIVSGITVIHNETAQRFIKACNAGAAKAKGDYIVLLNNDTEPTLGWLDALIDAFERFPNVGLAGSKLLYPDGKLQDAGGIIWNTGNPWNYGNRQNPWDPRFCYARQADYLSGAAMMTTRAIWDAVGGLSSYLEPMYFEDTDFAFKVREAGYTTWFVPSSVVYHYEGMTSGTDTSSGFKRYQEVNRPKFKRRWSKAFTAFGPEGQAPDLEKDRGIVGRVLFIDYTTPRPDRDAGSYAALQEMKLVQSLGYKVTFLPENMAHLGRYTEDLEKDGIEVITAPFYLSKSDYIDAHAAEFDAIYITRYYVGQATIPHIRRVAPQVKIVFNNADLHFLRQLRAGLALNDPGQVEAAKQVRNEELEVMRWTDVVLSYNDVEHAVIQSHTDGAVKVLTCPWVVDIPATVPPMDARRGLSFLGSFKHHPNYEGVAWFADEVMGLLAAERPDIALAIYGAGMGDKVRALAAANIDPVGYVADVADAYDRHRVFVAPLLSGAGIKGKVLSALSHGVPTVLSPVAAEGVGLRHGHDCMIAVTPRDWVDAIGALYDDAALWAQVSENGRAYVAERFSFETGRAQMRAAFEAVDLFGSVA